MLDDIRDGTAITALRGQRYCVIQVNAASRPVSAPLSAPRLSATRPWQGRPTGPRASDGGRLANLLRLPGPGRWPGCCLAGRGPLAGHGDHSAERSIEHPFPPVDFLTHVQDQRREFGCIARPDPGTECGQADHERAASAHCRPRGHLRDTQALKREEAPVRAGRSGVVRWQSPLGSDHRYRFVLCGLRLLRALCEV